MLSKSTIDQVMELPIDIVIGQYVKLEKKGSNLMGLSPFQDEKTPSFSVSLSKNRWKCFSTGKGGGNAISFVIEKETCGYIEAVKMIADKHGIPIEFDDSERARTYIAHVEKQRSIYDMNASAIEFFQEKQSEIPLNLRRATPEMYEKFMIGFAPDSWSGLMDYMIGLGYNYEQLEKAGLIYVKEKKKFDFFRNRIMIPIIDERGNCLGFTGRDISPEDETKKSVKVLNTKETEAFHKDQLILGIFQAKKSMRELDEAVVVEGNFDVTSFHEIGQTNTVACLGSAFTDQQAKIIKKFTSTITLAVDNDKAGINKIEKNTKMLLNEGFVVFLFIPEIEGFDPDDVVQKTLYKKTDIDYGDKTNQEIWKEYFNENKLDAVEYLAELWFNKAKSTIEKNNAQKRIVELLCQISDVSLRNSYVKTFASKYKIERKEVEQNISTLLATKNAPKEEEGPKKHRLPSYLKEDDLADWEEFGFYADKAPDKIGYYFPSSSFGFERISNFIIKPLFQISDKQDSKRFVEIKNKFETKQLKLSNKAFVSTLLFEEEVINEGNFIFDGSKKHFQKLRSKIIAQFPVCSQIKTLGWQKSGFYAFANGIVDGHFKPVDKLGIVHREDKPFFLPAFSNIVENDDDENLEFEADRYFAFRPSDVTFHEWSTGMRNVYGENGIWASIFTIASIYRSLIFSRRNFFPILFMWGQPQTGKSTCAYSVSKIFFGTQPPFNLNSGTNTAFNRKLSRTRDAIVWFDEFRNDINPQRFQQLKGGYDGVGTERGVLSRDNRTEVTKVNSALLLAGQHLPTYDENALFSRTILLYFERKASELTQEDNERMRQFQNLEEKGLSNIIMEVIKYRPYFEQKFDTTELEIRNHLTDHFSDNPVEGRVMMNYAIMLTVVKLLEDKLRLPFTFNEVLDLAVKAIVKQSDQIAESDELKNYWKMIEFLTIQNQIQHGADYVVLEKDSILIRDGRKEQKTIKFEKTTKVLFLRFARVHPLYMEAHRKQMGENGIPEQNIKSYMKTSKYFFGNCPVVNFDGTHTSGYAFDYEKIGVTLKGVNLPEGPTLPF